MTLYWKNTVAIVLIYTAFATSLQSSLTSVSEPCKIERIANVTSCFPEYTINGYVPYCFNTIVLCTASCFSTIWNRSDCLNLCFNLAAGPALDQFQVKARVHVDLLPSYSQCILETIQELNTTTEVETCRPWIYGENDIVLQQQADGIAAEHDAIVQKQKDALGSIIGTSIGIAAFCVVMLISLIIVYRSPEEMIDKTRASFFIFGVFSLFIIILAILLSTFVQHYQSALLLVPLHHVDDPTTLTC